MMTPRTWPLLGAAAILIAGCSEFMIDPIPREAIERMVQNCELEESDAQIRRTWQTAYCTCMGREVSRSFTATEAGTGVGPDDPRMGTIKASCRKEAGPRPDER